MNTLGSYYCKKEEEDAIPEDLKSVTCMQGYRNDINGKCIGTILVNLPYTFLNLLNLSSSFIIFV